MINCPLPTEPLPAWAPRRPVWYSATPRSPMLAGAVALAAGRFQPLVRLDPVTGDRILESLRVGSRVKSFQDVLSLAEARRFARLIEATAATITGSIQRARRSMRLSDPGRRLALPVSQ